MATTKDEGSESAQVKLIVEKVDGKRRVRVRFPWRSPALFPQLNAVYDSIMELADLPENKELPRILEAAARHELPSIWRRVSPSRLEHTAVVVFTALAFSSKGKWPRLVTKLLRDNGWYVKLPAGRPTVLPEHATDVLRGKQIDTIKKTLARGLRVKQEARRKGGYASDDQEIERKLQGFGYGSNEVMAIMKKASLNAAACYCWYRANTPKGVTLRAIQNGYARYLKSARPL